MKEVEKVSLGGYAFTLDQDAAELAREYLGELEQYYASHADGTEILEGIEERMAELLQEKTGPDGVGSRSMIEEITAILGRPEVIEAEGESGEETAATEPPVTGGKPRRKLYRDLSDKVVAGVCSGLGTYFNTDKALFRILFTLFALIPMVTGWHGHSLGTFRLISPILYIVLWISMPPAKTARQRWEQRGEDGTLESLQRNLKSNAREVEEALRTVGNSPAWNRFGKAFEKVLGIILLLIAFSGLFAGALWVFGDASGVLRIGNLHGLVYSELYRYVPSLAGTLALPLVRFVLLLVLFLPFLGILYGALQILFGFQSPKWHPGLVIFILWLLAIIAAGILIATGFLSSEVLTTI